MNNMKQENFSGFTRQTFEFFMKIGFENTPQRFEELRGEFNETVLLPLKQLSLSVSPLLATIDAQLDLRPVIGGTISRIRRDTRFSKNKAPYRTMMWLKFTTKNPGMRLAYYFDLNPSGCAMGLGTTHSTPQEMTAKRKYFLAHPGQTVSLLEKYKSQGFTLYGPGYKRPPQTSEDPVLMDLLKRKYFGFEKPIAMQAVFTPDLSEILREGYASLADFYHFYNKQS